MADESYSIVFSGEVVPGHAEADVRAAMAKQFRLAPEQVERLFSGRRAILKKGLDAAGAARFETALNRIGAAVKVVIGDSEGAAGAATSATPPAAAAAAAAPVAPPAAPSPRPAPSAAPDLGGPAPGPAPKPAPEPELDVDDPADPYRPPSAAVLDEPMGGADELHEARRVPAGRGAGWLGDGWAYFKHTPGMWIGIYVILGVIFVVPQGIPILGVIVSLVLTVLGPVFFGGVMIAADRQRRGERLDVADLFAAFNTHLGPLAIIGALYLVYWIVLSAVLVGVGFAFFGTVAGLGGSEEAMVFGVIIVTLVGLALSVPVFMLLWFAPALVVLHDVPPVEAMKTSFMACLKNIIPFTVNALVLLVLTLLTVPTLMLGMLVLGPVWLISIYASYRDVFVD